MAALGMLLVGLAGPVQAQGQSSADDTGWRVRLGVGRIDFQEDVRFRIGGQAAPGASAKLEDNTTVIAEIGYRFTPHWSANLTLGVPPKSDVDGSGSAEAFGNLGEVKYGPMALTAQYQFRADAVLRPYLGAGAVYYAVFDSNDGAVSELDVDNAWGSLLQAGFEYRLSPRTGLFLDVKKLFLKTDARGSLPALGGAPVTADVRLDPLVFTAGWVFQF